MACVRNWLACGFVVAVVLLFCCAETSAQQSAILTCVYQSWSTYRKLAGRVMADEVPAQICTHAIYIYASIQNNSLGTFDPYNDLSGPGRKGNLDKFASLKTKNPRLKSLIGVGGWNAGGFMFSQLAMSASKRQTFIDSVVQFCKTYNFDGIFIDWLVPGVGSRGGDPEDYANFPILLKEMKAAFRKEVTGRSDDLLITITISADVSNIDYYDVDNLNSAVDIYYLLGYDFYGPWSKITYHHSPLFNAPGNYSVDASVRGWLKTTINRNKLSLAITATARTYVIPSEDSDDDRKIGVKIIGDGKPGPWTLSNGTLSYAEVCRMLISSTYTTIRDQVTKVPHTYSYEGDFWMSYENEQSVKDKASYAITQRLGGGIMIFSSDQDDPRGYCGVPFPLSRAIRNVLAPLSSSDDQAFISSLNARIESRCFSQQSKNCDVTLRCPRIGTGSFAPGELECPTGQNCTFPTSVLDCVVPPPTMLGKDKAYFLQSSTSVPATYVKGQCHTDQSSKAEDSPGKFYTCGESGFGGDVIDEFICPKGFHLYGTNARCINDQN
ncbi:Chitinase-3-like protein 1 [Hypsibius exemplaris]|uniref:Chitinase-3-like protein 1 n=1 Tax=Hypsibius exemplaris TaxID=2072580 RepID=A0A1W0WD88_HYPEX|nr:Chitinase-3-like protein 1 [Hypsibius exemplaris]